MSEEKQICHQANSGELTHENKVGKCDKEPTKRLCCFVFPDGSEKAEKVFVEHYSCQVHANTISANTIMHKAEFKRALADEWKEKEKPLPDFDRSYARWVPIEDEASKKAQEETTEAKAEETE